MRDYLHRVINGQESGVLAKIAEFFLLILSGVYLFLVRLQDYVYTLKILRPEKINNATVISVGNITWGGTGKTSMVMALVDFLSHKGKKIALLSRGYKSDARSGANAQRAAYKAFGDEAFLLKEKYPNVHVLVGRDRILNAAKAVKELNCDTIILDDGFQYRKIKRDLNILLIDVLNPFGNGYCMPRGIMREPLEALSRADIIVLTNCEFDRVSQKKLWFRINWINDSVLIVYASYHFKRLFDINTQDPIDRASIMNKPVCLLASIGNFASFRKSAEAFLKTDVSLEIELPDHYEYSQTDVENILKSCRKKNIDTIITTEKDAVRLRPQLGEKLSVKIIVLEVKLEIIENKDKFLNAIENAFNS